MKDKKQDSRDWIKKRINFKNSIGSNFLGQNFLTFFFFFFLYVAKSLEQAPIMIKMILERKNLLQRFFFFFFLGFAAFVGFE